MTSTKWLALVRQMTDIWIDLMVAGESSLARDAMVQVQRYLAKFIIQRMAEERARIAEREAR